MNEDITLKDVNNTKEVEGIQEPLLPELEETPTLYKEEPWRWINLSVFVLASLLNCLPTHTFTPINSVVSRIYDVDKLLIAMNTLIFPISHPLLAFLANWIIDKYGLRIGCGIGSIFIIFGVWARTLISFSFAFTLLGSLLAAVGNIFIINSPSKLANVWFKPSMVALVTTLGVMSNLASNALGVVFPSFFVNRDSVASDVQRLLLVEAIITTVPFTLCLLLIRKKPNQAPSYAAANTSATENYKGDLKKLFSNKNYLLLMLVCSASYGTLVAFTSIIEYLILPFKYDDPGKTASNILLAAIVAGFVGSVVFVTILKKTRKYKKILIVGKLFNNVVLTGCALETVCVPFTLNTHSIWASIVIVALTGFFFIPQVPIILEFGCELAFPIGEASSSGFLLAGGQLLGFLAGTGFIQILDGQALWKVYLVMGCFVLFLAIGAFAMFFTKEDLRRSKYQLQTFIAVRRQSIKQSQE